jgi:MYXO-CTERM domain-containing protein
VPGQIPDCAYVCGEADASSGATAKGLTNGKQYAVGVAAFDDVDNVGDLSTLACSTPVPVDDFFDLYRAAGGQGGNCACGIGGDGDVLGAGLLAALGYAAVARRRRRRVQ